LDQSFSLYQAAGSRLEYGDAQINIEIGVDIDPDVERASKNGPFDPAPAPDSIKIRIAAAHKLLLDSQGLIVYISLITKLQE